ncbi:unnamed protein product [Spodoptera exigua]|nr:unnamed protein product [Spodoptera exigua]
MSAIKVNFEIGHEASLRSKKTPEGFTHDWEVFVRGLEGADISHFVDKVVFLLHETFKKPRRVVKEPPFSIKESGYAGFIFPIEIYLKNKDEPKKIKFSYDFTLQQSGSLKDRYIFQNPNEEFRKKLLKGGGIPISNNAFYTNPDQESRSRDSFTEEKQQLVSKPKLTSDSNKKHKSKEHKEEMPHKTSNNSFENLFGPPIQKPPKVSPDPKKIEKIAPPMKSDKKDKERSSSDKKQKHEHKEMKSDKVKLKEEKDKGRQEKIKNHNKEGDKPKDKSNKRPIERTASPDVAKKRCLSPIRRVPSPPRSSSASSIKDDYKPAKHNIDMLDQKKPKLEDKSLDGKIEKESKEKKKKEKKSHDRDKERKDKKEHKKESHKLKESPKEPPKEIPKEVPKLREVPKEKETIKDSPTIKDKPIKPEKPLNKFSLENLIKTPDDDRPENHKSKEKSDPERKHKHKKKDKRRDESREKHKESNKEKKHKHDKNREMPPEKMEAIERRETPIPKERPLPEPASPISIDTASQCSSKSGLAKSSHIGNEDVNSSHSDSESSVIADEEDSKVKIEMLSPEPIKHDPSPEPEPELDPEPELEPEPEPVVEPPPPHKEKKQKHKDKSAKREEKRRKRKAAEAEERENLESIEHRKIIKTETAPPFNDTERGESSGSTSAETKVQDNGVSSSLGEDAEPGELSPDYMVQLRDLQQRIMKIKNNDDLERVVNLIAETGRYEVTTQTFDFDLCLLDRSTVQQLIQIVG